MKNEFCQLYLTCANTAEAIKIANTLLVKQFVACTKWLPINSRYRWQGKLEVADEVLLIMDSRMELFDVIEKEVAKLHSYNAFVLEAVPVSRVSAAASDWLKQELADVR